MNFQPRHIVILLIGLQPLLVAILLCIVFVSPLMLLFSLVKHFFPMKPKKKEVKKEVFNLTKAKQEYEKATSGLTTRRNFDLSIQSKKN